MGTIVKFKYYGHRVMSRKFKYQYIENTQTLGLLVDIIFFFETVKNCHLLQ